MKSIFKLSTRFGFIISLLLMTQLLSSQQILSTDSVVARINRQVTIFPQEKLHVHNDKPLYISGEKIWFRAHLVDSYAQRYDSSSIYVYGELINPLDSVVSRVKVRRDSELYAGHFALHEDYPAGTYSMRFYTKYMESLGDDYFFKKNVEIGGPFSSKYKTDIEYTYSNNNKKLDVTLQFIDQKTEERISPANIAIAYHKEQFRGFSKEDFKKLKIDIDKKSSFSLNVNKELVKSIYVEYEYDGDFHCEFVSINAPTDDFHVDFFPEGGNLLSEKHMNIAFKALYSDGLSTAISGLICSEAGDTITSFNTVHQGMGVFPFWATTGHKYYAICKTENGMTKNFNLPEVLNSGYGLAVKTTADFVQISLLTTDSNMPDDLTLILQSRGHVIYANNWSKDDHTIQIGRSHLPTGVIHCLLVNNNYEPICERLFFNYTTDYAPQISLTNNKQKYQKRDKVVSNLTITDNEGQPLNGNFSVSVTDNKDIKVDSTQSILTTLLLTSELKGYIENPSFYFRKGRLASYALDVLMQTQGWRKYDMPKVLQGDLQHPQGLLEFCQTIRGEVKSGILLNQKGKDIPVSLLSITDPPFILSDVTDQNGRFLFRTDLPDSLSLVVRATTKKGGNRVHLELEDEKFPVLLKNLPKHIVEKRLFNSYFEKADLKYTTESGMRMINLKDVEVVGKDMRKEAKRSKYSSAMNTVYDSESFARLGARTLKDVLSRLGGIRMDKDQAFIRANAGAAAIYVDDVENADFISIDPPADEIESVEVVKDGMSAMFGAQGSNGVILITTKRGDSGLGSRLPALNVAKLRPLGYQATATFYSPKYETAAQKNDLVPDFRTTLYWNPYVKVEDGKAEILFYTADEASEYTLLLEGLTNEGKPLHLIETIGANKN